VLTKGGGAFHPTASASCSCHYHGTLTDGTVFDSSYDRGSPTSFAPNQVIKGWTEAMQMMVEGDIWELYIPSDLAYGDGGSPPKIGGGDTLIFKIEIIKINGDKVPALNCDAATATGCNEKETKYIEDRKEWTQEKVNTEVARLNKIKAKGAMKPALMNWIERRLNILNQLTSSGKSEL